MEFQQWLMQASERLTASGSESPRRDAQILLSKVSGRARSYLLAFGETPLSVEQQQQLETLLLRREQGEPVAYLIGQREFWSLPLAVSPATLIPRPDTECLVEQALQRLDCQPMSVLDLGTGTGAIALAIASERPDCQVIGVDSQLAAVELAKQNGQQLAIENCHFLQSDWFCALENQQFHLIVSNPPYIDADDPHLNEGDVRFEPHSALVAANQGLADLASIITQAPEHLHPGGWVLLEHGWRQGAAVRACLHTAGFSQVSSCVDYGGNERVSLGQWLPSKIIG
jgi:release factor glutamine methyltransferase